MGIQGKRRSRSKKRRGWAHRALVGLALTRCPACHKMTPPHRACAFCGNYRGRKVVTIAAKSSAKHKPAAAKPEKETKSA
ncbi:MAG: 50S ribosomal protein L32 [Patescibacteria group bacterium]|nr:50S ribosomal protein L32 [Patescibacteria group bacterium]